MSENVTAKHEVNIKKNVMWNTAGSMFYCICQWLITAIVVHIATFEIAGYLSLAMTMSSSFSAISLYSMRNYQVSDVKGEYSIHEYAGSRILTCIIAFVCCAAAAGWGNSIYQMMCIIAFMLIRVAEAIVDVLHGIDQKNDRYDLIGKSYILRGIATVVSFTVSLQMTSNIVLTLGIMAVFNLLIAFGFDWLKTSGLEHIKPVVWSPKIAELLKKCFPIVVFTFLLSLENLIPKNVLQQLAGQTELGIYSTVATPTLVVQVFASVAFNPFLPRLSATYHAGDYEGFHKMLHKIYLALLALCAVITIGAALFGRLGLRIIFGQEILEHYYLFMPIVWCTILTAMVWILSAILIALRKIKTILAGMLVDFAVCVALVYPCIERFGKNGVSIVQLIALSAYVLFMIVVCEVTIYKDKNGKRENDEKISDYSSL